MNKDDVLKLATLSRIEIDDAEADKLSHEFEKILGYVSDVRNAVGDNTEVAQESSNFALKNVLREDTEPHVGGMYTESILAAAPDREGNLLKVKNIL